MTVVPPEKYYFSIAFKKDRLNRMRTLLGGSATLHHEDPGECWGTGPNAAGELCGPRGALNTTWGGGPTNPTEYPVYWPVPDAPITEPCSFDDTLTCYTETQYQIHLQPPTTTAVWNNAIDVGEFPFRVVCDLQRMIKFGIHWRFAGFPITHVGFFSSNRIIATIPMGADNIFEACTMAILPNDQEDPDAEYGDVFMTLDITDEYATPTAGEEEIGRFTAYGKHLALIHGLSHVSLHTDFPGLEGVDFEYTGSGDFGAYTRVQTWHDWQGWQSITDFAANDIAGQKKLKKNIFFKGKEGDVVKWLGLWGLGTSSFLGAIELIVDEEAEEDEDKYARFDETDLLVICKDTSLFPEIDSDYSTMLYIKDWPGDTEIEPE